MESPYFESFGKFFVIIDLIMLPVPYEERSQQNSWFCLIPAFFENFLWILQY